MREWERTGAHRQGGAPGEIEGRNGILSQADKELTCASCGPHACDAAPGMKTIPAYCPMNFREEELRTAERAYGESATLHSLALEAARTEAAGYCRNTRVQEIMDFADRIGARKVGIAHCIGLMREARIAAEIFSSRGFAVHTVCCKVGAVNKESLGLKDEEKVHPGHYEAACNPIAQAALLDAAGTQLNVVVGLCVGHDSLFFMHSKAPVTVLVAKDRVLGHNPVAALYTSHSYYSRLRSK